MSIPPLAGLATYERAAQPGYSVEKNVKLFLRYAWIEKRLMETGLYWLASTPEWEVKEALGLHLRPPDLAHDQAHPGRSERHHGLGR